MRYTEIFTSSSSLQSPRLGSWRAYPQPGYGRVLSCRHSDRCQCYPTVVLCCHCWVRTCRAKEQR
jgi:hypothetical protein